MLPDHPALRVASGTLRIGFKLIAVTIGMLFALALIMLATTMGSNGSGNRGGNTW
jgi:hypothetical protein